MKLQLETIPDKNQSYSLLFDPRLSDLFYWHFHPEYELVYIEAAAGPCHVGDYVSTYTQRTLVLIGANIPHLNFDYGVQGEYRKVVVHLKKSFVETVLPQIPELKEVTTLFSATGYGLRYDMPAVKDIGGQLFKLKQLERLSQYLTLLNILHQVSALPPATKLHPQPFQNKYSERDQGRMRTIYQYIDQHYAQKINLNDIARVSNMTKEAFCRYFKKVSSYTFIEFLNRYRISQAKRMIMAGSSISATCYASGFESLSYFNRVFKKITKENPRAFRQRYW